MPLNNFQSPLPPVFCLTLHSSFVNVLLVLYPSTILSFFTFFSSLSCLQAISPLPAPCHSFLLSSPGEGILILARLSLSVTSSKRPSLSPILENVFLLCSYSAHIMFTWSSIAGLSPPMLLTLQGLCQSIHCSTLSMHEEFNRYQKNQ